MGCAPCKAAQDRRNNAQRHVYDDGEGNVTERSTQIEAEAMKIRNGGKGSVKPVNR